MTYMQPPAPNRTVGFVARFAPIVLLVGVMWVLEILDQFVFQRRLDTFGIIPRTGDGLIGIGAAPFLHFGFGHLIANSGALLVLGALILLTTSHFWVVTVAVGLFSGLGVWLVGESFTLTAGASGLVYGYAAFLVAYGFFARSWKHILVSVLVAVLYGGIVFGMLPTQSGVSWQGHLFGAIVGVIVARWLGRRTAQTTRPGY